MKKENNQLSFKIIESQSEWSDLISRCLNYNFFASFEWGEYKKKTWIVNRVAIYKNGTFIGGSQILLKKKLGIIFGWSSCGLLLTDWRYLGEVSAKIRDYYKENSLLFYVRFNLFDSRNGERSFILDEQGILKPSFFTVNSGYTVRFDLQQMEDLRKALSSNNRYYLKQAEKNNLEFKICSSVDVDEFVLLHNQMTKMKDMSEITINVDDINRLKTHMDSLLRMYSVCDNTGRNLASCLVFFEKQHAYYYLAASAQEGREKSASFKMVFELLKELKYQGVKSFDFSGITPFEVNAKGVNRFKLGFGGRLVRYIGEYEFSSGIATRLFFNVIMFSIRK